MLMGIAYIPLREVEDLFLWLNAGAYDFPTDSGLSAFTSALLAVEEGDHPLLFILEFHMPQTSSSTAARPVAVCYGPSSITECRR